MFFTGRFCGNMSVQKTNFSPRTAQNFWLGNSRVNAHQIVGLEQVSRAGETEQEGREHVGQQRAEDRLERSSRNGDVGSCQFAGHIRARHET